MSYKIRGGAGKIEPPSPAVLPHAAQEKQATMKTARTTVIVALSAAGLVNAGQGPWQQCEPTVSHSILTPKGILAYIVLFVPRWWNCSFPIRHALFDWAELTWAF